MRVLPPSTSGNYSYDGHERQLQRLHGKLVLLNRAFADRIEEERILTARLQMHRDNLRNPSRVPLPPTYEVDVLRLRRLQGRIDEIARARRQLNIQYRRIYEWVFRINQDNEDTEN